MVKKILQSVIILTILLLSQSYEIKSSSNEPKDGKNGKELKASFNKTKLLWPLPQKLQMNETGIQYSVDPCTINYRISATPSDTIKQIINIYLIDVFHCANIKPGNLTLSISVKNPNQMVAEQVLHEKY
jgi:hypothetical protein